MSEVSIGVFIEPNKTILDGECLCIYAGEFFPVDPLSASDTDDNMKIALKFLNKSKVEYRVSSKETGNITRFLQDFPERTIKFGEGVKPFNKHGTFYQKESYNIKEEFFPRIAIANIETRAILITKDEYKIHYLARCVNLMKWVAIPLPEQTLTG